MGTIAHGFRQLLDFTIWPLVGFGPWVTLTVASMITALAILLVVRYATPADWITRSRSQIAASIYEVRLFLDSPLQVIKSQGRLLGYTGIYLLAILPALIIMTVPMGLLFLQLELRYQVDPVGVGEPVVVTVKAEDGIDVTSIGAEVGDWGQITAMVRDPLAQAVYMRLVVAKPGARTLTITHKDERIEKRIDASAELDSISPIRSKGLGMWWQVTGEPPIDSAAIAEIEVATGSRSVEVARMPWWLFWLLLSTIFALVLRKPFKVTL